MKRVLILYRFLPQYRVDFYNFLREELLKNNIELTLIYGKIKDSDDKKNDEIDLPWAIYREYKVFKILGHKVLWQPCMDKVRKSDLIIVEQANKLLINYILIILRRIPRINFKLAYWGHGANLQDDPNSLKNRFKYLFIDKSDYWFAYTDSVKKFLIEKNVKKERIKVVNNAIDTKVLRQQYLNCSYSLVENMKKSLGITGEKIAIYSGALYDIKRISFLIDAGERIYQEIKEFNLVILGAGPDEFLVNDRCKKYSWLHYVGPKFGIDRIVYFKMADIFLLPGAVGLAILDAFATETPLITTDNRFHGPEISYLKNNINGVITGNSLKCYSDKVIELLHDKTKLKNLKREGLNYSNKYSKEDMVENFVTGIDYCLAKN